MNGSADYANALIEEGNIFMLTNFHPSILFDREMLRANGLFAPRDLSAPRKGI
jgi:hypothetical protein